MIAHVRLAGILVCAAAALAACETTDAPETTLEYGFDAPAQGPRAGRDRLRAIDAVLRGPGCRLHANFRACGQYAMEAGLIYALVEHQEIESANLLDRAYNFDPGCDVRILRANAAAKEARIRRELSSASALLSGAGCDGTVARYYVAKFNILSTDDESVRAGRAQLGELSSYSLGNSGIAPHDLYDLAVYSLVSTGEFDNAETKLREALDRNVAVSPKLQALTVIGRGGTGSFTLPPRVTTEARDYLLRRVEDFRFGGAIEAFLGQAASMERVQAAPWEDIESRMEADPNLTPSQRNIVRLRFEDEFERLRGELAAIDEAKGAIEAYGPGLVEAEKALVAATVLRILGDGSPEAADEARDDYKAALRRLAGAVERIDGAIRDMAAMSDLQTMLVDPEAWVRAGEAAAALSGAVARVAADNADALVLRDFAAAVSRDLSPEEFFRAWEVDLDQLGFDSERVVENVRRVMELAG